MKLPTIQLLVEALNEPAALVRLSLPQWDTLIHQGRSAGVLARIAVDCASAGILAQVPEQPRRHLVSAANLAQRQHRELRWEVKLIEEALAPTAVPVVLLKGAAYALCGLTAARGRMMTDVDILVPRDALPNVESALMKRGWMSAAKTAYDQRYYRTWMHELPPMRHINRGTVIDVHHAIVPLTSRAHPDSESLLAAALPVRAEGRVKRLAAHDMLLHSSTHLFHEGELEQGFRGLVDIDSLLREFGAQDGFWEGLVPRAAQLQLIRPLFYGLRYAALMLATPVPSAVLVELSRAPGAPSDGLFVAFMDALFLRALRPPHASTSDRWTPLARLLLYLRGHWLRMPPWLLIRHLTRKMVIAAKKQES